MSAFLVFLEKVETLATLDLKLCLAHYRLLRIATAAFCGAQSLPVATALTTPCALQAPRPPARVWVTYQPQRRPSKHRRMPACFVTDAVVAGIECPDWHVAASPAFKQLVATWRTVVE